MSSKNVTFRFQPTELSEYDAFASAQGINRTTLVRKAVRHYIDSYSKDTTAPSGAIEAGKALVGITSDIQAAGKHPLYLLIKNEGLKITDENESVVATITDLDSLFDFVNTKVLKR